ncbi:MAG: glycosyltransferase family 2 protein [Steroidobacteraceae bacterium]
MFTWILWPVAAYIVLVSAYMLCVVIGSWVYVPPGQRNARRSRIAIIVPAHNEGARITRTLSDLSGCDYPRDQFEIIVIADNCTDDTAAVARRCHARVYERHDQTARGKGQALDWLLRSHAGHLSSFDVIAFVDADMYVDRGFLAALNDAFADPRVEVAQGRNTVANPTDSWLAAFGFMSFAYVNHVRAAGRCFLGGSCGLKGSGMAFRSPLILETGWPVSSIAEDLDFGKELVQKGVRIHYIPGAVVTSDIASSVRQVQVQQARWEGGKKQAFSTFFPRALRSLLRSPSRLMLDEVLDMLVPPLSMYIFGMLVVGAISLWLGSAVVFVVAASVVVFGLAVFTGLVQLRMPARAFIYLALSPVFMLGKLVLFARLALSGPQKDWKRTPRDGEG